MIRLMPELMSGLASCPLFGRLAPAQLQRVVEISRSLALAAEQVLFREGDPCQGFYVVCSGSVRLFKIGPDGRERILHVVRSPGSFAEAALFGRGRYPAHAAAMEPSELILVRREPFLRMLREQPDFSIRLFESLSRWLHRLLDQLENETFLNARAKLANYLLREIRRQGDPKSPYRLRLAQPKKDVASQLGMAPETYSRAQADLEGRGLIQVLGRHIEIRNPAALEWLLLGEE